MPPLEPFAAGFSGGGAGLGNAAGAITLDVSDLLRAEAVSKSVGRNIEQNLGVINRGTAQVQTGFGGVGQAIDTVNQKIGGMGAAISRGLGGLQSAIAGVRGELLAIGAIAGLGTAFGLRSANEIRVAQIRLRQFVNTEEEAADLMESLAEGANRFGLEINEVLSFSSTLLPILEGNVEAVDAWVVRAARLRSVFPQAIKGAELRAISEFLSGNAVSLQRLFNISQSIIADAKNQFSDMGDQLDYILDRMGATEQAALDMADPIVAMKNELKLAAEEGFGGLLRKIRELAPYVTDFIKDIRETHPEILQIGAAALAAAAIGAPLLLFLGQVLSTLQKIKALGILGTLGRLGLAGLAIGGTAVATTAIGQNIAREKGDVPHLENASFIKFMTEGLKVAVDILASIVSVINQAIQMVIDGLINFAEAVVGVYTGLGNLLIRIGEFLPDDLGGDRLKEAGENIVAAGEASAGLADNLREVNDQNLKDALERTGQLRDTIRGTLDSVAGFFERISGSASATATGGALGGGAGGLSELQQAQIQAWEDYQDAIIAIETRGQERRLALTEQYESQRTQIIARYEQTIAREAEDFARQRARANQQLEGDIQDIRDGAIERELEWQQDLDDSIIEIREDSAERIAEIEADAARRREQMERDHRLTLLEAASRLDARAVASEQRRFANQIQNFEQDLRARIAAEHANAQERIQQEQQAHQQRLAEARQADEERIGDLREAHAERIALEDEDRAIRLDRMKQDHEDQLDQLRKANRARLTEQKNQQKAELDQLKNEFTKQNIALTNFYDSWLLTQTSEQEASLRQWEQFWKDFVNIQNGAATAGTGTGGAGTGGAPGDGGAGLMSRAELEQLFMALGIQAGYSQQVLKNAIEQLRYLSNLEFAEYIERVFHYDVPGYKYGTPFVPNDQLAFLHKGEAVIDAPTAAMLRRSLSGGFAVAGGSAYTSSRQVTVGDINIYAQPGQSAEDIGLVVERRLTSLFKGLS